MIILREMMLQFRRKAQSFIQRTLSAVNELECALIYECKSTHGLTDKQIEEIKNERQEKT
jgi:hypothetical protein